MVRPLSRETVFKKTRATAGEVRAEERKPNLTGPWIYVGTFIDFEDPGNDPSNTVQESPDWENSFYYVAGAPVAYRHGLDGQTDMIGVYDLTLGAVSGDAAFHMPLRYATNAPFATAFPVELDTDVWSIAIQKIDPAEVTVGGVPVRIYWPIYANVIP